MYLINKLYSSDAEGGEGSREPGMSLLARAASGVWNRLQSQGDLFGELEEGDREPEYLWEILDRANDEAGPYRLTG
jgi:hypothetical protein